MLTDTLTPTLLTITLDAGQRRALDLVNKRSRLLCYDTVATLPRHGQSLPVTDSQCQYFVRAEQPGSEVFTVECYTWPQIADIMARIPLTTTPDAMTSLWHRMYERSQHIGSVRAPLDSFGNVRTQLFDYAERQGWRYVIATKSFVYRQPQPTAA